nr:hypothetical protein [Piscirickettsia salmonis]
MKAKRLLKLKIFVASMVLLKAATTNSDPNIKAWAFQIYSVYKELEDENRRLKQMYADISLEHKVLKEAPSRYFQNPKLYGYYLILGTKHLCGDIIPTLKSLA